MLLFPNPVSGGPRGDLGSVNFSMKSFSKLDFFLVQSRKKDGNFVLASPPAVPPTLDLERATSQLSLEKKINVVKFLDQFLVHFK